MANPTGKPTEWRPLSRAYINELIQIIIRIFDWGVSEELVPVTVANALAKLPRIHKGKEANVKESRLIKPVPIAHIEAVLKVVSPEISAMIRLQTLTAEHETEFHRHQMARVPARAAANARCPG